MGAAKDKMLFKKQKNQRTGINSYSELNTEDDSLPISLNYYAFLPVAKWKTKN